VPHKPFRSLQALGGRIQQLGEDPTQVPVCGLAVSTTLTPYLIPSIQRPSRPTPRQFQGRVSEDEDDNRWQPVINVLQSSQPSRGGVVRHLALFGGAIPSSSYRLSGKCGEARPLARRDKDQGLSGQSRRGFCVPSYRSNPIRCIISDVRNAKATMRICTVSTTFALQLETRFA